MYDFNIETTAWETVLHIFAIFVTWKAAIDYSNKFSQNSRYQ